MPGQAQRAAVLPCARNRTWQPRPLRPVAPLLLLCYAGSGTSTGLSPGNPPSLSSSCMTLLHFRSQVDNLRGCPSGLLIGPVRFER
jgi:hypothetical protein